MQSIPFPLPEGKLTLCFECGAKKEEYRAKLAILSPVLGMIIQRDNATSIKIDCSEKVWDNICGIDLAYLQDPTFECKCSFDEICTYLKIASAYGMTRLMHVLQQNPPIPHLSKEAWDTLLDLYEMGMTRLAEVAINGYINENSIPYNIPVGLLLKYLTYQSLSKGWLLSWCLHHSQDEIILLYNNKLKDFNLETKLILSLYIQDAELRKQIIEDVGKSLNVSIPKNSDKTTPETNIHCFGCDKILTGYIYNLCRGSPPYCSRQCWEDHH